VFALTSSALAIVATLTSPCPAAPSAIALAVAGQRTAVAVGAADEAARLWAPYGVSIETLGSVGVHGILVHVRLAAPRDGESDASALGTIEFHDGVPDPDVTLYPQRAWTLIVRTAGSATSGWPLSYRDQVLGRVLGRALAHELGHFLLQMPAHTATGLMRAVQPIVSLMEATRSAFTLSADEIAVLQARSRCGSGPSI
jgi:hypothetical protein